jgi:hypothetical protein
MMRQSAPLALRFWKPNLLKPTFLETKTAFIANAADYVGFGCQKSG